MDALDVARWQFGVTTVYHFLFVPLTIGLGPLVATLQTLWHRTGNPRYLRLTHFYGKLFLINFAMGVVTGIVQEFQFGMNWSDYSRFVGDVFGAPLAMEALLAFFLESTFLGLWIFGWEKLPKRVHLATIWTAALGSVLSMFFILAANSWMQNPVGFRMNPDTGRPELTDIWAVLTNKVALITFPHTLAAAFLVAGALLVAVSLWHVTRRPESDASEHRFALKLGAWVTLVSSAALVFTGDIQGKIMTEVQPMKMAAAEALYQSEQPASFSVLTIGTLDGSREVFALKLPYLLSFLATGDPKGAVEGINDLQARYAAEYGPGSYSPIVPVTYWSFRVMITLGLLAAAIALLVLWSQRRGRTPHNKWLLRAGLILPLLPLGASTSGWIFTEMGRQPWIVFGELLTRNGVSRSVSLTEVLTSFLAFTLIYAILALIEGKLLLRYAKAGLPPPKEQAPESSDADDDVPALAAY
ncbi:cytochrome ubiquinol oxidase subunit I [Asanoa sp. WMMD1127]|uniref:cytochrome ubiquinol oxidase subunit I n=1 Tax=Asanoa sp. WMMD1127 TaxID=3016107 RepID=UPI0024161C54|nr:cytochrome ubiquinol oxidase subunit I [Asanoa sp. WMMD1127]MDG4821451.1 cytochrome ubiquinol oxidase subunit I [Asanoa sp. WMMD1127]